MPGNDPNGFLTRDEIISYFERYVHDQRLPVHYGTHGLEKSSRDQAPPALRIPFVASLADYLVGEVAEPLADVSAPHD